MNKISQVNNNIDGCRINNEAYNIIECLFTFDDSCYPNITLTTRKITEKFYYSHDNFIVDLEKKTKLMSIYIHNALKNY